MERMGSIVFLPFFFPPEAFMFHPSKVFHFISSFPFLNMSQFSSTSCGGLFFLHLILAQQTLSNNFLFYSKFLKHFLELLIDFITTFT